mmetsp:Transcript_7717/g.17869  ORF Transcript_7717/g.17869 Transcript_7717/m.17869 type:complete len:139 (+) Transcript_7717:239-655(+)
MTAKGKSLGLNFEFDTEVGNSMDSLRLLHWAGQPEFGPDKQEELAEELALGHFEKKQSVGKRSVLLAAAERVGLPAHEARVVLESGKFESEVLANIEQAHSEGHHSIPVVSIAGHLVHGSASVEEFEQVIRRVDKERG